jgi:hypothetical protein
MDVFGLRLGAEHTRVSCPWWSPRCTPPRARALIHRGGWRRTVGFVRSRFPAGTTRSNLLEGEIAVRALAQLLPAAAAGESAQAVGPPLPPPHHGRPRRNRDANRDDVEARR